MIPLYRQESKALERDATSTLAPQRHAGAGEGPDPLSKQPSNGPTNQTESEGGGGAGPGTAGAGPYDGTLRFLSPAAHWLSITTPFSGRENWSQDDGKRGSSWVETRVLFKAERATWCH